LTSFLSQYTMYWIYAMYWILINIWHWFSLLYCTLERNRRLRQYNIIVNKMCIKFSYLSFSHINSTQKICVILITHLICCYTHWPWKHTCNIHSGTRWLNNVILPIHTGVSSISHIIKQVSQYWSVKARILQTEKNAMNHNSQFLVLRYINSDWPFNLCPLYPGKLECTFISQQKCCSVSAYLFICRLAR
jgi:hypothetical protein